MLLLMERKHMYLKQRVSGKDDVSGKEVYILEFCFIITTKQMTNFKQFNGNNDQFFY